VSFAYHRAALGERRPPDNEGRAEAAAQQIATLFARTHREFAVITMHVLSRIPEPPFCLTEESRRLVVLVGELTRVARDVIGTPLAREFAKNIATGLMDGEEPVHSTITEAIRHRRFSRTGSPLGGGSVSTYGWPVITDEKAEELAARLAVVVYELRTSYTDAISQLESHRLVHRRLDT
jgi:hypothetical protein